MFILYKSQEEQLIPGHINKKVASCAQAMHRSVRYMASTGMYSCEMETQDTHKEEERKEASSVAFLGKDSLFSVPH